jgi:tRNA 2-thiouridine synthesizing protein A
VADRAIDIRGLLCPLTWARVKRELLQMHPGERLQVTLDHRPAVPDIRRNAADLGHDVSAIDRGNGVWELVVELS